MHCVVVFDLRVDHLKRSHCTGPFQFGLEVSPGYYASAAAGFVAYCLLRRKIMFRGRAGPETREWRIHQLAVFGRYLFVREREEAIGCLDSRGHQLCHPR
jgi:hypothetical protein